MDLNLETISDALGDYGRTLRGCVDLNLMMCWVLNHDFGSHPTRVRGFKFLFMFGGKSMNQSHPTRVRGFKLPTTGIIERDESRTLRGCVDLNIFCK